MRLYLKTHTRTYNRKKDFQTGHLKKLIFSFSKCEQQTHVLFEVVN